MPEVVLDDELLWGLLVCMAREAERGEKCGMRRSVYVCACVGEGRKCVIFSYTYSTSQTFGHTYSFKGYSLFVLCSTLYNNSEDIKTMK